MVLFIILFLFEIKINQQIHNYEKRNFTIIIFYRFFFRLKKGSCV